ncbi:MAG: ABC transporter substrate-binding protein [Candidatus Thermoplasmatota archaeon]|nr:ABC transporter substrate-binding protein [Candidatus Thermoplasmatota archaeon]
MLNKKHIAILVFGILVISGVAFSGCVEPDEEESKAILRMGFSWPTEIDPAIGTDESSSTAYTNFYDPLVFPTQTGVEPWIAEDWTISEDGTEYTFDLRDDVTFHSGNEMTAEDVMFSMERLTTIGQGFAFLFDEHVDIENSTVVDDYTVKFVLEEPRGVFLSTLTRLYIVDKEDVLNHADEDADLVYEPWGHDLGKSYLLENSAGTGPYEVYDADVTDHFYGEKNEDYWGPMADNAPDEFRMLALGDPTTERSMFGEESLEVTSEWLEYGTVTEIADDHDGKTGAYFSGGAFYGQMHTQKEPLDCVHVRKAIAYSFNYTEQIEEIFPSSRLPNGIIPSVLPGATELDMPRRNITKAEEELQKSKYYPDIVENPSDYKIEISWTAQVPATEKVALMLAGNLDDIGLEGESNKYQWGALIDAMSNKEDSPHVTMVWVTAQFPEAGGLLQARYHSDTADSWEQNEWLENDTIDGMIEDALAEPNKEDRFALYEQLQKDLLEMSPSLFLHSQFSRHAYQDYVTWPHAEDPEEHAIPTIGYNKNVRMIEVLPPDER